MIPTREKLIGENKVEEYTFGLVHRGERGWPSTATYINDKMVGETYDQAVTRLERETLDKRRQV